MAAALRFASGVDAETFEATVERTRLESHHGGESHVLDVHLTRARDIRAALAVLWTQTADLANEVDARTDDHGVFHFRVSKQDAFASRIVVTRGDDAIQVRLKPEVHPASREAAVAAVTAALGK